MAVRHCLEQRSDGFDAAEEHGGDLLRAGATAAAVEGAGDGGHA